MLRRLAVLSQIHCSELDKARLNVLAEVKTAASVQSSRAYASRHSSCLPQSTIILGGGPTGMLTAIHCTQHVLASGGEVKLYEHRDGKSAQLVPEFTCPLVTNHTHLSSLIFPHHKRSLPT
jgi:hypothetical protein